MGLTRALRKQVEGRDVAVNVVALWMTSESDLPSPSFALYHSLSGAPQNLNHGTGLSRRRDAHAPPGVL